MGNVFHSSLLRRIVAAFLCCTVLLSAGVFPFSVVSVAYAQQQPVFYGTTLWHVNHTFDRGSVGYLDNIQYGDAGRATPYVQYQRLETAGYSGSIQSLENDLYANFSQTPSANQLVVWAGHGVTTGSGVDGLPFTRQQLATATSNALERANQKGTVVFDDCGSGNVCRVPGLCDAEHCANILASSPINEVGYAPDLGEDMTRIQKNFQATGQGDKNGDDTLSVGEFWDELYKDDKRKTIQLNDPNVPMFFRTEEAAQRATREEACLVVTPGTSEKYGKEKGDPNASDSIFAALNNLNLYIQSKYKNRGDAVRTLEANTQNLQSSIQKPNIVGRTVVPSANQAREWLKNDKYTVDGVQLAPGRYNVGSRLSTQNGKCIIVGKNCTFSEGSGKDCQKGLQGGDSENSGNANNLQGGGNNGDGNGGGGGEGSQSGGALGQLLPLLGSMLGSMLGNRGGQQQTQATPTPTPHTSNFNCTAEYAPVCDIEGRTQPNRCVAQGLGKAVVHDGACSQTARGVPSQQQFISGILEQVANSGIPQPFLNQVVHVVARLIASVFSGSAQITQTSIP